MAKLNCPCGNQLSNSCIPNEIEGTIIPDHIAFDCDHDVEFWTVQRLCRDVWECPQCGRLAINYPAIDDSTVKWYKPEDGTPGHLMAFKKEAPSEPGTIRN